MRILKRKTIEPKAQEEKDILDVDRGISKGKSLSDSSTTSIKRVLLGTHVSEKAASMESNGVYTFKVAINSSKIEIKEAVRRSYGVLPVNVSVMNVEGKRKNFGKTKGRRSDWKKAIVTLPKGKNIDIHSGI